MVDVHSKETWSYNLIVNLSKKNKRLEIRHLVIY
jgi:hypothetical protein